MSVINKIDRSIETLIANLVTEYSKDGLLSTPTPERKAEIVEHIATLRASMSPQCTCQKD